MAVYFPSELESASLVLHGRKQCVLGNEKKAARGLDMTRQGHEAPWDTELLNLLSHTALLIHN